MHILITTNSLGAVGGVQVYVRDLAVWLLERGHSPMVFGPSPGIAAEQLRRLTIPVVENLASIGVTPDIIHGNSAPETVAALLHFTSTPALFVCHGWRVSTVRFPRILRYVAVDETCADWLRIEQGIPASQVTVLLNAVDLERFVHRDTPLPRQPKRALVFGNTANEVTHVAAIRAACEQSGIAVDVTGLLSSSSVESPEEILHRYDLVFAKAKCALEGMATGAAVILCDARGLGGMVRAVDVPRFRRLNFGARSLSTPITVEALKREIAAYDPVDAAEVSGMIRATAAADDLHSQLLALYEQIIAEHAGRPSDWREEGRAAAAFLTRAANEQHARNDRSVLVLRAAQRIFSAPLIGRPMTRLARWLVSRGPGRG